MTHNDQIGSVRMPRTMKKALLRAAKKQKISLGEYVRRLIAADLRLG